MTIFSYIARTTDGTLERGKIEANSADDVREKLRKKHLFAEEIQAEAGKPLNVGFPSASMPWTNTDDGQKKKTYNDALALDEEYLPLIDTLRLFAGWLLAWYAVVYLFGSMQLAGKLPFEIPLIDGLFLSSLVLRFAFANFLFLLLTSIYRSLKGDLGMGIGLSFLGVIVFFLFHLNA